MPARSMTTATMTVTADVAADVVGLGGYTHPLFHPVDPAERPLPGQAVLLFMGGLVEQSGVLDHAVAMLEISNARFATLVRPGARLRVEVTPGAAEPARNGRFRQTFTWTAYDEGSGIVATVEVLMLLNELEEEGA